MQIQEALAFVAMPRDTNLKWLDIKLDFNRGCYSLLIVHVGVCSTSCWSAQAYAAVVLLSLAVGSEAFDISGCRRVLFPFRIPSF